MDDYVRLPYRVTLDRDDEGGKPSWVASVDDLPGCTSRGRTPETAVSGVSDALAAWIEAAIREGREVPEPRSRQSHSGRLLLRMPQTQRLGEERLDELGDDSSKAEPHADSRSTSHRRSRYVTAALVANFVLVALAAVVAILVLIAAWR